LAGVEAVGRYHSHIIAALRHDHREQAARIGLAVIHESEFAINVLLIDGNRIVGSACSASSRIIRCARILRRLFRSHSNIVTLIVYAMHRQAYRVAKFAGPRISTDSEEDAFTRV
jgi:hypothetical protein